MPNTPKSTEEAALLQLKQQFGTPEEILKAVKALQIKRREERFPLYWEATDKQKELLPQFTKDVKVFGILGGNRSGKTEVGALIAAAWAVGKAAFQDHPAWEIVKDLPIPEKANNIWVVGLDFPTLRDVIWGEKLRRGRNHPPLFPDGSPFLKRPPSDSDFQIFLENGSVITGKSADSGREKFQGASVDLVWIDEECEADVFDECYQRTSDCAGKLLITLTPLTDISSGVRVPWVYDLYRNSAKPGSDVKFVKLSVLDNPYVPAEEKQKLKEKWAGKVDEKARLYGDFVQRSGLVYPMWDATRHVVKSKKYPEHWRRIVSIDPAATGITAALWAAVEPGTNNLYFYREYYEKNLRVSDHAKNILVRNAGDPIDIWLIDPKWGSQRNNETHKDGATLYRENGIPVRLADVGNDWGLNVSIEYISATCNPTSRHAKAFFSDNLTHFRDEIERYVWAFFAKGELAGMSKEKPVKKDDHLMNAFQYLCALRPKGHGLKPISDDERVLFPRLNSYT